MTSIIWDMGGTLVNTYPQVDAVLYDVARTYGVPLRLLDVSRLTRTSIRHAKTTIAEQYGVPYAELDDAEQELRRSWKSRPAPLMPHAHEVLAAVRDSGGMNLVVTHRDRDSASSLISLLGIEIDDMLCAPDGYPRKPDSTMYELILQRHNIAPEDAIGIGDREIDTQAASGAGMRSILLTTPDIPVVSQATWVIDSLDQVLPLL
ncbi:MAG: HAD-IA family hydrolase [Actinomycetaceae bacterium]|nr:HAD-IA family hydrolase [Actinomycetaceae bacterium]